MIKKKYFQTKIEVITRLKETVRVYFYLNVQVIKTQNLHKNKNNKSVSAVLIFNCLKEQMTSHTYVFVLDIRNNELQNKYFSKFSNAQYEQETTHMPP